MDKLWLYFYYWFDVSVVNSFTLSIPHVNCHLVLNDDFLSYSDSVFVDDLWISNDITFLTIQCVSNYSDFTIDLKRRSWIQWCYGFHSSAFTRFSVTISRSTGLSFCWLFMDQEWHSVFDNSMHQPWLYFCYRFDASIMNSFSLSIAHVSWQLIFSEDLKVYSDSVFADNLWISRDITFSTIPCVNHDSIFAIESYIGREFIYSINFVRSCHSIFIDDFKVYSESVFADDLWISCDIACLPIPCVSHGSIFAFDLRRRSWIHWRCWFHTPTVTQYSIMISKSTPTKFLLTIYGSVVTLRFWQFHASAMTLFLLLICCVGRELIDVVDFTHQLSLSSQWWFQGLRWLCFSLMICR